MDDRTRKPIVVGTRGSALALWQAEHVIARLRASHPGRSFVLRTIQTRGDADQRSNLAEIGTRGIFVKEIETALLSGEIDLGVHSLKDLPSELHPGLALAAVTPREDPRDALVCGLDRTLAQLPSGARLGTGSPRRAGQILAFRPDLVVENIRGNVDTRVRKALTREYDGVVLAVAGLRRLGLEAHITDYLPVSLVVPAPGQGIVAVEARCDDAAVLAVAAAADDASTNSAARAERAFVRSLGGGCTTPLGAYARVDGASLRIEGVLANPQGTRLIRESCEGDVRSPEAAGEGLARLMLEAGGREILAEIEHWGAGTTDE